MAYWDEVVVWKLKAWTSHDAVIVDLNSPVHQASSTGASAIQKEGLVTAYKVPLRSPLSYLQTVMNLKPLAVLSLAASASPLAVAGPLAYGNRCVSSNHNPSLYPQLITRLQHAHSCVLRCSRFRF